MANDNFDLPRPTDAVPSATSAVINDDAKVLDYVINGEGTVTTRTGKVLLTIDEAINKFGFGIADFTFAAGGTLNSLNLLISNSPTDGYLYKYVGAGDAPIAVGAGTNPVGNSDWQPFSATEHNLLSNRNVAGAHDLSDVDISEHDPRTLKIEHVVMGDGTVISGAALRDSSAVARVITSLTDCHAFADKTEITSFSDSGTYGAFDATTHYNATQNADHLYQFQARGKKSNSGNISNIAGFYSAMDLEGAGEIENVHHLRCVNPTGDAPIVNHHGIHIQPLDGAENNFAIFSWGNTPSVHVGAVTIGSTEREASSAFSVVNISDMTGLHRVGINSNCAVSDLATSSYSAYKGAANLAVSDADYNVGICNGYKAADAQLAGGNTITTLNGFLAQDQTKGSANRGFTSEVVAGTAKWNLYMAGSAQNYMLGNLGIGSGKSAPTAKIDIAPATGGGAGSAPIKLTAGVNLSTPETGAFEFDGVNLYFTIAGVRKTVQLT